MAMKFDPARLGRLNDPGRTRYLDITAMWQEFGRGAPLWPPREVVDLGAGTGFFAVRVAALLAPGSVVHACDSSQVMVDWMRTNLDAGQLASVRPTLVPESAIGLPDRSVDLLYMINVFHELANPAALLADARRVLRAGAPAAIVDWKKGDSTFEGERHGPPDQHRREASAAHAALEAAGFTDIRQSAALPLHFFLVGRAA